MVNMISLNVFNFTYFLGPFFRQKHPNAHHKEYAENRPKDYITNIYNILLKLRIFTRKYWILFDEKQII
jgi:hypothetical protein